MALVSPSDYKQAVAQAPAPVYAPDINSSGGVGSAPYGPVAPVQQTNVSPTMTQPAVSNGEITAYHPSFWEKVKDTARSIFSDNGQIRNQIRAGANELGMGLMDATGISYLANKALPGMDEAAQNIHKENLQYISPTAAKVSNITGQVIGMAPGIEAAYATGGRLAAEGLAKFAPKAPTLVKSLARGVGAGTAYGTGEQVIDAAKHPNDQTIGERLKNVGEQAALFGAGDAALSGLGEGVNAARKTVAENLTKAGNKDALDNSIQDFIQRTKDTPLSTHSNTRLVQEVGNGELTSRAKELVNNFNTREAVQKQYEAAISDQYDYLKQSMKDRGGVDQGGIIQDQHGDVTGRYGRISNNPPWYQDFYQQNGRVPTDADLRDLAKQQIDHGFQTETGKAPAFKPTDLGEIDQQLQDIQDALPHADASTRKALEDTTTTLNQERARLQKLMPESVSALPIKETSQLISPDEFKRSQAKPNGDVQALTTQTPDGRPLLPVGGAGSTPKEAVKISDIVANLSKKLDIPIRVARYRQKAHGIFKVQSEVVRTKLANDLPTISHEVGHALDKQYGLGSSQFDSELLQMGKRTSGRGYTKEQVRKEGVAEFFRHMLTDPQEALKQAPNFYAHTMQILPKEVQAVLKDAQEQIKGYIDQPILAKIESKISVGKKEKKPLPTWNDLYKQFVDEQHPIQLALKELGPDGVKLMENFQLLRGVTGRAQAFLKQGVVDGRYNIVGKSFEKILEPVKADLKDFRKYLIAKRAVELEKRGIHASSDLELSDWESAVAMLEQQHPDFQSVQKEVLGYQDSLLDELVKSGMLTREDVNGFKEVNKEYVPFFREYEAEAGAGATRGGTTSAGTTSAGPTLANQRNPIKRIKGSARDIVDPLESIIKNTYQYVAIAERNKAMREFVTKAVKEEGLGGLVEKIPAPMTGTKFSLEDIRTVLEREGVDTDAIDMDAMASIFRPSQNIPGQDNVVTVFRNGKREFYQLDPELYRAVMSADKDQMGVIVRALNFPTRLLRSGVVNTLEFWLRNMWKDQFSALINSKNGYIPFIDMFRGMAHVLKKDEVFTKFLAAGGGQGLRQSLDRKYLQSDLRKILAASMKDKSLNILKHPLQAMQAFSEVSELGTRLGEFSKGLKKDGSPQGVRSAAVAARDLIDFGRAGTIGKNINKVSAFWNSQVQGLDKTIRAFKAHPVKNFAKATAAITAPTFGLYELNKNDPRYQELQQWDKDLFWHFWIGDAHFRLPIPFELGIIFKVLPERIMNAVDGKEGAFRQFASQAANTLSPIPTTLTKLLGFVTALNPVAEVVTNKNFAGAPIVPRREENLSPEDQYGPYTSTAAKLTAQLAGKVGLENTFAGSPRKLEHIIQGYTGSLGQYALQGTDMVANASGIAHQPPKPATGLESMPGFKAIMGKSIPDNTDSMDRFYERLDQLTKGTGSAKKHGATYDAAGEAKVYNKVNRNINDLRSVYRNVLDDPDMTPDEKRAQLNDLNAQMNDLAKTALSISKDLKTTP